MIRPEFKSIHKTYGTAMEKLGIINGYTQNLGRSGKNHHKGFIPLTLNRLVEQGQC